MRFRIPTLIGTFLLVCLLSTAGYAQVQLYSQDFELLFPEDAAAMSGDGWLVFGNVFDTDGTSYLYGYGPFPAPNHSLAFCQIVSGEGGAEQGLNQLSVFNDYENLDHALHRYIESNVYREWNITGGNVGQTWYFRFDAKMGNLELRSTAAAFIKTLNPAAGYAMTNFITRDMTEAPTTWKSYYLKITIDETLVGQLLQIGFMNMATDYEGSGVFYDNLRFDTDPTGTPPSTDILGATLAQNYPNPFNPSTRIDFTLERAGTVEISVYNLAGRHVATLQQGELDEGDHFVLWNGRTDSGAPVASGQYQYVLKTSAGQISRSMVLLK